MLIDCLSATRRLRMTCLAWHLPHHWFSMYSVCSFNPSNVMARRQVKLLCVTSWVVSVKVIIVLSFSLFSKGSVCLWFCLYVYLCLWVTLFYAQSVSQSGLIEAEINSHVLQLAHSVDYSMYATCEGRSSKTQTQQLSSFSLLYCGKILCKMRLKHCRNSVSAAWSHSLMKLTC